MRKVTCILEPQYLLQGSIVKLQHRVVACFTQWTENFLRTGPESPRGTTSRNPARLDVWLHLTISSATSMRTTTPSFFANYPRVPLIRNASQVV